MSKTSRLLAAFLAPLVVASAVAAGGPPMLNLGAFHAKIHMSTTGAGKSMAMDGEMWIKDKKMRMNMSASEMNMSTIMADGFVYQWPVAPKQGFKMPIQPQQESTSLLKANDCLKTAKPLGSETIDGVATEKYEYKDCGGHEATTTIWIATGKGYPKKFETVTKQGTSTILYKDVETGAGFGDSVFAPPKDVQFQDMGDMMKKMQQQQRGPGKH